MNLEAIEQKCISYLSQVSDPLVPVDTLLRYLQRDDEYQALGERELLDFLEDHELFKVVQPLPFPEDSPEVKGLLETGFRPRPRVMLATRVPTAAQLREGMVHEVDRMLEALGGALYSARDRGDRERVREVQHIIRRAKELRSRIEAFDQ